MYDFGVAAENMTAEATEVSEESTRKKRVNDIEPYTVWYSGAVAHRGRCVPSIVPRTCASRSVRMRTGIIKLPITVVRIKKVEDSALWKQDSEVDGEIFAAAPFLNIDWDGLSLALGFAPPPLYASLS